MTLSIDDYSRWSLPRTVIRGCRAGMTILLMIDYFRGGDDLVKKNLCVSYFQ